MSQKAIDALSQVQIIIAQRAKTHGDADETNNRIADLWSEYLGQPVTAQDVAVLMILLKVGRCKRGSPAREHLEDVAGYAAIGIADNGMEP